MAILRSVLYNLFFYFWTGFLCITLIWTMLLPRPTLIALIQWYLGTLQFMERNLLGLDYRVVGLENLPPAPYLVAAKHQSTWETMKLHLLLPDPAVVLKQELMRIPIWGWFAGRLRMISIDRKGRGKTMARMMRSARARVAEKRPIVIFPQGSRIAPGDYESYKVGTFGLYQALEIPVVPMALNSGLFWGRKSFVKKAGTITVEYLPPIPAGLDRRPFMRQLEERLEEASERLSLAAGGPPTKRPQRRAAA